MGELLSSLDVKPLEGQTQSVSLVKALPVNMHREPVLLLSQHPFVPLILILEHRLVKLKTSLPQKWRGCMGIPLYVPAANIVQESKIRDNWIPYMPLLHGWSCEFQCRRPHQFGSPDASPPQFDLSSACTPAGIIRIRTTNHQREGGTCLD